MEVPKQVPYEKPQIFHMAGVFSMTRGASGRTGGGGRMGLATEGLKNHINEFCLHPRGNGMLLRDF